jgi:LysM repeat protein
MSDPSDLEATISESFESRAARLHASAGDLDDVMTRVEHRRSRHRRVAIAGSFAVVGVGAIGIVALGSRDDSGPVSPASEEATVTVDQTVPTRAAWRCDDQLAYWGETGDEVYFASCEQTTIDAAVEVLDTAVTTVPPGDVLSPVEQLYVVVAGDSLVGIAETFGIGLDVLVAYNEWPEGVAHPIFVGDEVRIPPDAFVPGGAGTEHPTTTTTTTTIVG